MTEVLAGQRIRAADWNRSMAQVTPYDILKAADESLPSSTTYQNDNEIAFPGEANRTYKVDYCLYYSALNAADIKQQWTGPAGCTWTYRVIDISTADTTTATRSTASGIDYAYNTSTSSPYGARSIGALNSGGGTPLNVTVRVEAILAMGGTSGTFQLQWAQVASNATPTVVAAGSWLRRTEMVLSS